MEHTTYDIVTTLITTIIASSGFWALLEYRLKRRDTISEQRTLQLDLLRGLSHDRIMYLGLKYIRRGCISADEYENLHTYLYLPYVKLDGNGSAARVMAEVDKLPVLTTEQLIEREKEKQNV